MPGGDRRSPNKTACGSACTGYFHIIDRLVYELYGLTEEEIRIVEGATQG